MLNIKKASIVFIAVLILIITFAMTSFAGKTGTITKEAKLRKTASESSIVLEIIPKKEKVEVLEKQGDWYQVKYNKIKGYVQKDFIEVEEPINNTIEQNAITQETSTVPIEDIKEGDTLTVRSELKKYIRPLINSTVIENIENGKTITVEKIINEWAYVNSDGRTGWVRLDSIMTTNSQNNDKQEENEPPKQELNKTAYIVSTGINFREKPNTDAKVLKVFAENAKVTILEEQGEWYKIKHNDQIGYVIKTYVSENKVTTTSRSSIDRNNLSNNATENKKEQNQDTTNNNTASSKGEEVANYVKQFVGCKYVYGGSSPNGFDCSGLTMYVYKKFGVSLSHSATAQSKVGTKVNKSNLQPGDLVFFTDYKTNKGIGHVGIYIGNNKFVHASTEKTGVITSNINSGSYKTRYVTATRLF